jgi:hypothetical protein
MNRREQRRMKTRADFEPDESSPSSLRELVLEQISYTSYDGKTDNPLQIQSIDELMQAVYARIEQQALETYHSNEIWALRQWALSNILKNEVIDEATTQIAHNLVSPVIEWQDQSYDPVAKYRQKLVADGKPEHSIGTILLPVTRFVSRKGRKRNYSDDEIIEHVSHLRTDGYIRKHRVTIWQCAECGYELPKKTGLDERTNAFKKHKRQPCPKCGSVEKAKNTEMRWDKVPYKPTTLYNEVVQLKQFLEFLHGRNWTMPVAMPAVPEREEMYQPMLSDDELESLIFNTLFSNIPAEWIVRLAASTLYGCRVSELGDISIYLDGEASHIYVKTRKKGMKKRQPIPTILLPIFAVDIEPMKGWRLQYILKSMCKKADVELPERAGWHSLRRRVVTDVYEKTTAKEMPIITYFRWSNKQRHLSQLPTYVKSNIEETDRQILAEHPILKMWTDIIPLLMQMHPEYSKNHRALELYNQNIELYNEMI